MIKQIKMICKLRVQQQAYFITKTTIILPSHDCQLQLPQSIVHMVKPVLTSPSHVSSKGCGAEGSKSCVYCRPPQEVATQQVHMQEW